MVRWVPADLHVHTALSPCGGEEMKPPAILLRAEQLGIKVLGVVDHCTARNARAVWEAAEAFDVRVMVGLEIESAEGVHILTLFHNIEAALDMDAVVADHLPALLNRDDIFGPQQLLDEWGNVVGHDDRLLAVATDLTLEQIADIAATREGMSIPAHIDRSLNGLLPVLGFVPPELDVELFELSRHITPAEARRKWPELSDLPLVTASDAHHLADIGQATCRVPADLAAADLPARRWGRSLAQALLSADNQ